MIIVVGSLNMDLFIQAPRLPRTGETVLGTDFRRLPGGKGANQAVAVARMGARAALLGAVGQDSFGKELVSSLIAAGVGTKTVVQRKRTPTGAALIVVDTAGQNQIVVAAGANATLSREDVERRQRWIRRAQATIAQLEIPLETVEAALRIARGAGSLTVLNPAPCGRVGNRLLRLCDWIIPNETEAEKLSGMPIKSLRSAAAAAQVIGKRADGANVTITLGDRGAWLHSTSFTGHIPGVAVRAVDAVGAGDTFIGAFVTRLVEGATSRDAARFACAAAALSVTRPGAQSGIPSRTEVNALVN